MSRRPGFRKRRRARKWKPSGRSNGKTNRLRRNVARDAERAAKEELRRPSSFSSEEIFEAFAEQTSYARARGGVFAAAWDYDDQRASVVRDPAARLEVLRAWARANPDRVTAAWKRWSKANRHKRNALQRAWRKRNRERTRRYCREAHARHRDARNAAARVRARRWYAANKERAAAKGRASADRRRKAHNTRYAAKRGATVKRRPCGLCRAFGHNRRTCHRVDKKTSGQACR